MFSRTTYPKSAEIDHGEFILRVMNTWNIFICSFHKQHQQTQNVSNLQVAYSTLNNRKR